MIKFERNTNSIVEEAKVEEEDEDSIVDHNHLQVSNPDDEYRSCMPVQKDPKIKPSVWKIIKDFVGKDLSKLAVPVYFNEPISMLQKLAEPFEYENLLVKANNCDDEALRIIYVGIFNVA